MRKILALICILVAFTACDSQQTETDLACHDFRNIQQEDAGSRFLTGRTLASDMQSVYDHAQYARADVYGAAITLKIVLSLPDIDPKRAMDEMAKVCGEEGD